MQPVYITDPNWQTTFPHLVGPLPDEWLPGLLLRCDEVNSWEAGATARQVFRTVGGHLSSTNYLYVSTPPVDMLERLSQVLAIPLSSVVATTYLSELARLTGVSPKVFEARADGYFWFFICPECLIQERLLRRTLALSHIRVCSQHHLMLQYACRCGELLSLFDRKAQPFTCAKCHLDWGDLPRIEASGERIALEQEIQSYYTLFFSRATPELFSSILALIKKCAREQRKYYIWLPEANEERFLLHTVWEGGNPSLAYVDIVKRKYTSLGTVVYSLIDLGLSIDDIKTYAERNHRDSENN